MMRSVSAILMVVGWSTACTGEFSPEGIPSSTVRIALGGASADVVGVQYEVTCASGESASVYVELEEEGLPYHLSPALEGAPFTDLFLVLQPGFCEVTATPMQSPQLASDQCSPAYASGFITAEETTEWLLVIECTDPNAGAVDIVSAINYAPTIDEVLLNPGPVVQQCDPLGITVSASDLDGDNVTVTIEVVPPQVGAAFSLSQALDGYQFTPKVSGVWTLIISASDGTSVTEASVDITATPSDVACSSPSTPK
jgi:hypothetical protein